jgi:hypothetical protein
MHYSKRNTGGKSIHFSINSFLVAIAGHLVSTEKKIIKMRKGEKKGIA